jgi:transmembrane sensor
MSCNKMKNYVEYTVEDFAQDAYFRQWILSETPSAKQFWETWCQEHPEQKDTIAQATSMVIALKIKEIHIPEMDIQRGIEQILRLTEPTKTLVIPLYQRTWFRVAASVVLLISVGFWWTDKVAVLPNEPENTVYTKGGRIGDKQIVNNEDKPFPIILPDGSTVVLEKNSQISYDKDFKGAVREVHLKGEALFDVVKNPNKPFVVYAGHLVTKVLGTSFRIKAFEKEKDVTVNVIRGRVSVFADKKDKQKDPETDGLILTPNQKVVFTKIEEHLKRTLVEKPVVIIPQADLHQFVFEEAPISTIFKAIEKVYGVEVIFDQEVMKNCALTTTLKNETLFDKLAVICKSIGATYKIVDAQVIINGEPCQ